MKKILLLLCFCALAKAGSAAQDVLDKLQGKWVCDSITNELGEPVDGNFGKFGRYLEFNFKKRRVETIKAPYITTYDRHFDATVLDSSYIFLLPVGFYLKKDKKEVGRVGGEIGFEIISRSDGAVILKSAKEEGNKVMYILKRPKDIGKKSAADTVDLGYVMLRYEKSIMTGDGYTSIETGVGSSLNCYYGIPRFEFGEKGFNSFFGHNLEIPDLPEFKKQQPDDYLVLLDVTKEGLQHINVSGANAKMKEEIKRVFTKGSKRWEADADMPVDYTARLKFHFYFYRGEISKDGKVK